MADLIITERSNIVTLANAIREKTGATGSISLGDMISDVEEGVGGIDTSDATAAAGDIMLDKTAYVDGEKVTGSFTIDSELSEQDNLIAQISTALEGKTSAIPTLQSKTVSPSTSSQIVEPDNGYDGLSSVIVNAMATATQATPSISVNSSGLITASATQTEGYVTSGTKSATKQLTTQAATTITPSTSSQTAVAKNVYTTGAITVGAIPSSYVKPTTTKAATTYTPTTTNQTIAKGTYCSGVQTIKGDANLKAENIAEGVSIFGIEGTHSGGGGSSGTDIETCTVNVSTGMSDKTTDRVFRLIAYNSYKDGIISSNVLKPTTSGVQTLTNVIKDSIVCLGPCYGGDVLNNATNLSNMAGDFGVYRIDGDATIHNYACFVYGTKILLSNNTIKKVQDIAYNDELLVWDFDNGCYTSAKPLWIKKSELTAQYYHCVFEDGTILDLVGGRNHAHRIFCLDTNRFEYANDCVGKTIVTYGGLIKLVSCEVIEDTVEFYNIITDYHMNLFANNVLTSTGFNNLYSIENMKFIKEDRELIPIEAFDDCSKEYYYGMRLGEQVNYSVERINEKIKSIKELAI